METETKIKFPEDSRAKILMQYAGRQCFATISENETANFTLRAFREVGESKKWYVGEGPIGTYPARIVTVKVKPLGKISNKDKSEIIKIFELVPGKDIINIFVGAFLQELHKAEYNTYRPDFTLQAIDFLRERGYALPYKNWSVKQLVEFGIYKLID